MTMLMAGASATAILPSEDVLCDIMDKVSVEKETLKEFRTAKLWLQYVEMIGILRMFIKAERIGDWNLHLQAVHKMLPYFAAAGHNLYTKSAYKKCSICQKAIQISIPVSSMVIMSYCEVIDIGLDSLLTRSFSRFL